MIAPMVFAALAAAAPAPAPTSTPIAVAHYDIEIPVGYEARDVSRPMIDFSLYRVARKGAKEAACTLYFGNHASFPKLKWSQKPTETKGDRRTTTAFQRRGAIEGLIKFSGLQYQTSSGSPFTSIHYFCDELDDVATKDMVRMIESIKLARPQMR